MKNRASKKRYHESLETPSLTGSFSPLTEDLLRNVLNRLSATSFASACCVSKAWNRVCNRILSKPKLSTVLSQNPSLEVCVEEAVNKVLSEPIRPQFVIANVTGGDDAALRNTLICLRKKLGWKIPIVASSSSGIMGRDVVTNEFEEVVDSVEVGMSLTVGFFPGVKVGAVTLDRTAKESQVFKIDNFVDTIGCFSELVSGSKSPMAIIMFGNCRVDLKPTMEKLDYAMSKETAIVGDERAWFVFRTGTERRNFWGKMNDCAAFAFVFARDRWSSPGVGKIQFSAALSSGVSSLGPIYKASYVTVKSGSETWLTARREGHAEIVDGGRMLSDIDDELVNHNYYPELYIGVTKRRKSNKSRLMTFLSFHGVIGRSEEFLVVYGPGIRTGDYFQFYCPHRETALSSCTNMSSKLRKLKLDNYTDNSLHATSSAANYAKKECVGGFLFSCCGRTEPFLGCSNADSSIFLENFPGVPLAGVFCNGEFGRGISILDENEGEKESRSKCCEHVYSSVYLLVSYTPVPEEH